MSGAREVANALLLLLPTDGNAPSEEAWVVVAGLAMQGTTFEHDAWLELVGGLLERQRADEPARQPWTVIEEESRARGIYGPVTDEAPVLAPAPVTVFEQVAPDPEPEAEQAQRVALRDRYTDEERRAAIARAEEIGTAKAARELGIPYPTLWSWAGAVRRTVDHDAARARAAAATESSWD